MSEYSAEEILNGLSPKDREMAGISDSQESEDAPQDEAPTTELRAHHLFSVAQLYSLRVHKSEFAEGLYRNLKAAQFKIMGRGEDGREFSDHMTDSILAIMRNQVGDIKITNSHDIICAACPQRGSDHCKVFGREYQVDFLSMVDEAIAKNSNGVIEIGKSYPPEYIAQNIRAIRRAIRKTLLEIPLLRKK